MVMVEATVMDATHLELSEPIMVRTGGVVLISVSEPVEKDAKRHEWLAASSASLQMAYGDSEPDYPASMVRESNPSYGA